MGKHFWIDFKLHCVISSCDCLYIPLDIIIFFNTLDPLAVDLDKEINENSEATGKETN